MRPGQDSAEQIRRHEVSRALKKANLSPEAVEVIGLLSRSLIGKLLDGLISEVMARRGRNTLRKPTRCGGIVWARGSRERN